MPRLQPTRRSCRRVRLARMCLLWAAWFLVDTPERNLAQGADAAPDVAAAAAAFRRPEQAVQARADGTLIAEAEEFRPVGDGWQARNWVDAYYVATFANTFLSRKAFLRAAPQAEAVAEITVRVPADGTYLALVRYEACYRFETQFRLQIEQGGQRKLDRLYGATQNPKIWAFRQKIQPQVAWPWGAVENIVWEGHDTAVALRAGVATLRLVAARQPEPAAERHVDAILLTTDRAQVEQRIEREQYLPLDGMLTQEGDVFLRVHNRGSAALRLTVPNSTEHSPYWVHLRTWKPKTIAVEAGRSSDWEEAGSLLDCFNDGQWTLSAATDGGAALRYAVEVGVADAAGAIRSVGQFESTAAKLPLVIDGAMRYAPRVRTADAVLYELLDYLKRHPVPGRPPQRTLVYGYTFSPQPEDARYTAARNEFLELFNLTETNLDRPGTPQQPRGYIDVRSVPTPQLEARCQELAAQGLADRIAVVSLGDEIGLAHPRADDHAGFRAFLQRQGVRPEDVQPGSGNDWNQITYQPQADRAKQPRLYYYARRYAHEYGIAALKERTDILRKHLPSAWIGANYSPHHGYTYLGEVHQWVHTFRRQGMTLPWGEDYIWGVPVGTQQMNSICLDLYRAGLVERPYDPILYYVMPHWPGNTPRSWRRLFYSALGHGMKIVNLFEFRPVQAAYTENYVNLPEMYQTVRRGLYELATFEDIVQQGRVEPGMAALWFGETGDIWDDQRHPFAAAKRCLYIALRHQQLPLDIVTEEDALAGRLDGYRLLVLTDAHVSRAASQRIAQWVAGGGRLLATAGAGMFDELDQRNDVLRQLLGVEPGELSSPPEANVVYAKQDLPFSQPLDVVRVHDVPAGDMPGAAATAHELPVIAARQALRAQQGAAVVGTFRDGSPAVVHKSTGRGQTLCCGFLPGLTYFKPAIPLRPVDRGTTDDSMAHFLPTQFDQGAAQLVGRLAADLPRPLQASDPLVECMLVRSPQGVAIPLVNWRGEPREKLTVAIRVPLPGRTVSLASGNRVEVTWNGDGTAIATLDLDVADCLIVRP
jgi:hypothetical protein